MSIAPGGKAGLHQVSERVRHETADDLIELRVVLTQLLASRKAIQSLSERILEEHLLHCVEHADQESGRQMIGDLVSVLRRFVK